MYSSVTNWLRTEGNPWLVPFPRGYWLYEKSKHLYVSGYPIKAKLFRTVQEFAVHMIWLLSSSKDYKDCCCVHCNLKHVSKTPVALEETPTLAPSEPAKTTPKVTPVSLPDAQARRTSTPNHHHQQQQQQQHNQQQPQWTLQSPLVFRAGELAWYKTGNTWRLGIIAGQSPSGHEIVPLGFARVPQAHAVKQDSDMRPYQAFSVPPVSVPELSSKIFDEIPWEDTFMSVISDASKRDILLLDASKLAASKIDFSYSLWSQAPADAQGKTVPYYGCFLGAERVEVGDCLRLRQLPPELNITSEFPILGLRHIFTSSDFPGAVFLRGSLFVPAAPGSDASTYVPEEALPIALRDEVTWRNKFPGPRRAWTLAKEDVVLKESAIRGRFYPTHRLMPILNPEEFQNAVANGKDAPQPYLNSRMDGYGRYLGRKMNRTDAVGAAVPPTERLAMEPHVREAYPQ